MCSKFIPQMPANAVHTAKMLAHAASRLVTSLSSMVTIEESEVTKRLAAWASIFAVCTAFAGIWGMNFEHMPELKFRYGYAMALGLIVSTCGYLYYRFRRVGWL